MGSLSSLVWIGCRVVVVVPAYNEQPRIGRVLRTLPRWVDDVVVVDDGSVDGTLAAAREVGDARVIFDVHEANRGVGAAIATGYRRALRISGRPRDVFVVMGGDGQMAPSDLDGLVSPIAFGQADYVKGNRFRTLDVVRSMPVHRLLAGLVLSWATARAIGVPISDSQCGYTAISRSACEKLDLYDLWPRYGYPNDLLSQLALRGLRIAEAPVRAIYADEVSRLTLGDVPVVLGLIARAWLRRLGAREAPLAAAGSSRVDASAGLDQRS